MKEGKGAVSAGVLRTADLRGMSRSELQEKLRGLVREGCRLRLKNRIDGSVSPTELRARRKTVARIKTILTEQARVS